MPQKGGKKQADLLLAIIQKTSVHHQHPVRLERVAPSGDCHPEACIALTGHSVLMKVVLVDVRREKELYGNIWSINVRVRKTEKRGEEGGRRGKEGWVYMTPGETRLVRGN